MAYQTASAADVAELLDRLRLFLAANGWTIDRWADNGTPARKALSVHKGDFYATFTSQADGSTTSTNPAPYVGVQGHTGYIVGGPSVQAEVSPVVQCNGLSGPFVAYDFFEGEGQDGPYVHVVVEVQAGQFKHFGTGVLNKEGAIATGQYTYGANWYHGYSGSTPDISNPDYASHGVPFDSRSGGSGVWGYIRADADGASPNWLTGRQGAGNLAAGWSANATASGSSTGTIGGLSRSSPSVMTGRTHLWPMWAMAARPSNYYSPVGYPADFRFVRLDYLNPREVITLGTDQWRVFPVIRKNGLNAEPNSGTYGYAYRINE